MHINTRGLLMKKLCMLLFLWSLTVFPLTTFAKVNVFSCHPEWTSLVLEIGQSNVNIKTATNAFSDPHFIRAKPSLLAAIRNADLVICTGNQLEIGWLPILLERAKSSVQPGQIGNIMASDYVSSLEVPTILDRSQGDVHPGGNPHVHLNPHNLLKVAEILAIRLGRIDDKNASFYTQSLISFKIKWLNAISRWESQSTPLKNMPIVVYHKNWAYFSNWLGLSRVVSLEPKPGIPPSPSHLKNILNQLKENPARVIIRTPFENAKPSTWLSQQTGIPDLVLPYTVGGNKQSTNLYGLFDSMIGKLLEING